MTRTPCRNTVKARITVAEPSWAGGNGSVFAPRWGQKPPEPEKVAITAACERFLAEVLRPRFLPEIRPTSFNYPVAIMGKWHGNKYRFLQRFRSTIRTRSSPSSMRRSRVWSISAVTVLMCPGIAIRASGFASTDPYPSLRPCA